MYVQHASFGLKSGQKPSRMYSFYSRNMKAEFYTYKISCGRLTTRKVCHTKNSFHLGVRPIQGTYLRNFGYNKAFRSHGTNLSQFSFLTCLGDFPARGREKNPLLIV